MDDENVHAASLSYKYVVHRIELYNDMLCGSIPFEAVVWITELVNSLCVCTKLNY